MSESSQEAFERGHRAGGVEARLAEHEKHLQTINGSVKYGAEQTQGLRLDLQHMKDELTAKLDTVIATAKSASETVVATAEALRLAEEARRTTDRDAVARSEQKWTPWQRFLAVLGSVVLTVGTAVGVYAGLHP